MSEPCHIFISYARKDGANLAQRLETDLKKRGFDPWLDTQRLKGGATWTREIEAALDRANYVLVLLSAGSYVSEICRSEQLRALRKGTCVIPVKVHSDTDIPLHLEAKNYRDFSDATRYTPQFEILLEDIHGNVSATLPEHYRATPIRYITAPPRVANYLERPDALRSLRDTLFAEDRRQPIALTALSGMGGIGKTVLAKALTEDEVVQRAFPDGIVWITVGQERKRDFIEEMREVAKALNDDLTGYDTALACENRYRTTVAQKAILIVVDDVWSKADIEPLLAESQRSRFLFTTRDASIARFVGAREHRANLFDLAQARELLASWANVPANDQPPSADEIVFECGRLPFALSVVGAMLRGTNEQFWAATLNLLREADLSAIEDQLPEGQLSFFKAVEISVRSLKPVMQQRYTELAVLLEDMYAAQIILQVLWNVSQDETTRTVRLLTDRSLAQLDDIKMGFRLHDLQLDYVRAQFLDREALDLIHGALHLAIHVIERDPKQFVSQMVGRLLPFERSAGVRQFVDKLKKGAPKPSLQPLRPALHPPATSLMRIMDHSYGALVTVNCVSLSSDGRLAISASSDATIRIWDWNSGRLLRTMQGHSKPIHGLATISDGQRLISASDDQTLKVWDMRSGQVLQTLEGHSDSVRCVAASRDGRLAISGSWDSTLKVWDLETGLALRTLEGHRNRVGAVALSPDGQRAVSGSDDHTVKVWDVKTGQMLRTLSGHSNWVRGVALSSDGKYGVSASTDRSLKRWDLESGQVLQTLMSSSRYESGVAISHDGHKAVSSGDGLITVWDLRNGQALQILEGHASDIPCVALTPDGRYAVSASADGTMKVWDLEARTAVRPVKNHSRGVSSIAVCSDGRFVISSSYDGSLRIWSAANGAVLKALEGHSGSVNRVCLTPDGRRAISASDDKTLKLWEVESGRLLRTLQGHSNFVIGVTSTRDGQFAISGSRDKTLKIWDLEKGFALRTFVGHAGGISDVAIIPNGQRIISASDDKTLKVWDMDSGQVMQTLEGHSESVRCVAVSGDGRLAISGSWDKTLRVWDLQSCRLLQTLEGHVSWVNNVAISPDGKYAISAALDRNVKAWDLDRNTEVASFICDGHPLCCAFVSERKLVAGDVLGRLHWLELNE